MLIKMGKLWHSVFERLNKNRLNACLSSVHGKQVCQIRNTSSGNVWAPTPNTSSAKKRDSEKLSQNIRFLLTLRRSAKKYGRSGILFASILQYVCEVSAAS